MNLPLRWMLKRPGPWIPVFFLCPCLVMAQSDGTATSVAALGGTFLVRTGYAMARHNQAGLGHLTLNSFSIQHTRPFLLDELGISSLSIQIPFSHGGAGTTLSHYGIRGLGYTSAWIASGIRVFEEWCMGVGLQFWNFSYPGQPFHHSGFSFAAGLSVEISELIQLGAHLSHPAGFFPGTPVHLSPPATLTIGGSWSLFSTAVYYVEMEFQSGQQIRLKHGLEWKAGEMLLVQMGMQSGPFTLSCGIGIELRRWYLHSAFTYNPDTGSTPYMSLHHVW
jgi:hypothetical protein